MFSNRFRATAYSRFAIALLALALKVPHFESSGGHVTATALASGLLNQWPSYLAFITSFFTMLIMWVHHHMIFRLVLVTVVPFPAAVDAEYLRTPAAPAARFTLDAIGMRRISPTIPMCPDRYALG